MLTLSVDYNIVRQTLVRQIIAATSLPSGSVVLEEPVIQNVPRPPLPYIGMKITTPGAKVGDDSKQNVLDGEGNPTTQWSSGGVRTMTVSFHSYAMTHEGAYNLLVLLQSAFDLEDVQQQLNLGAGLAVSMIGTVADFSQLLNTGYEGRAQMDVKFLIAVSVQSDLGEMDSVVVTGTVNTNSGEDTITVDAP